MHSVIANRSAFHIAIDDLKFELIFEDIKSMARKVKHFQDTRVYSTYTCAMEKDVR